MREHFKLPQSELAARFGCTRQAWAQFEASESRGAISLASLRRAAEALGCEFSYSLRPRAGAGLEQEPVAADQPSLPSPAAPTKERAVIVRSFAPEPDLPTELL
jgi:transcriptional regulator with XRE-family HTH domain